MNAFLTGSRVYGTPLSYSDIDLVILVDSKTNAQLEKMKDDDSEPIRFGRLNLIALTSVEDFDKWKVGTEACEKLAKEQGPLTREQAVEVLRSYVGDKPGKSEQ